MKFIAKNIHAIILVLSGLAFLFFCYPFMGWILFAAIVSFSVKPLQNRMIKHFKINEKVSVYIILLMIVLFLIPFILAFVTFFNEGKKFAEGFRDTSAVQSVERLVSRVYDKVPSLEHVADEEKAVNYVYKITGRVVESLFKGASVFFLALPNLFLGLFIFCLSLFYFIADSKEINEFVVSLEMFQRQDLDEVIKILQDSCQSTVFAAVVTGAVQSLILSLTALGLGVHFFFTTLFVSMFLAQIPIIGTLPVAIGYIGYFYFQENPLAAVIMLIASVVAGLSDNVIRPWVLSAYDSLHPFAGLISSIGALFVFGPIGVLLGPVITLLFVKLLKQQYRKIIV